MNEVMVSICCLAYNHEKYIRQCLEGFVNQKTNFQYEVLIHDDASTDGTADIIREYEKKYPNIIKPIYQVENQYSQGKPINKYLYEKALGRYIALCEGDDYWCDSSKLQLQVEALELNKRCRFAVHKTMRMKEDGTFLNILKPSYFIPAGIITSDQMIVLEGNHPFHYSSYIGYAEDFREYANNRPAFSIGKWCGDAPLILYFITKGDFFYVDKVMSCYREASVSSISKKLKESGIRDVDRVSTKMQEMMTEFDEYTDYKYHKQLLKHIKRNKRNMIKGKIYFFIEKYFPCVMRRYKEIKNFFELEI